MVMHINEVIFLKKEKLIFLRLNTQGPGTRPAFGRGGGGYSGAGPAGSAGIP